MARVDPTFVKLCEPAAVDPVHKTVDLFHAFSFRKIIPKIPENPWAWKFYI
jgi:hypothetical protein